MYSPVLWFCPPATSRVESLPPSTNAQINTINLFAVDSNSKSAVSELPAMVLFGTRPSMAFQLPTSATQLIIRGVVERGVSSGCECEFTDRNNCNCGWFVGSAQLQACGMRM